MFSRAVYIVFSVGKPDFFALIIAAFFINTVFVGVTGFFDVFVNLSVSAYVKRVAKEFIKDFFGLVMLPYFAVVDLYVFAVSVVRSLTKKNLLLWKPFFAGRVREKKKGKSRERIIFCPTQNLCTNISYPKKSACARQFHSAAERGLSELYLAYEYRVFDTFRRVGKHS